MSVALLKQHQSELDGPGESRAVANDAQPTGPARSSPLEDLPEFLSPEEFRTYVGIGRSTIYELLRRDELPHVRFGRCIRISKSVLRTFVTDVK